MLRIPLGLVRAAVLFSLRQIQLRLLGSLARQLVVQHLNRAALKAAFPQPRARPHIIIASTRGLSMRITMALIRSVKYALGRIFPLYIQFRFFRTLLRVALLARLFYLGLILRIRSHGTREVARLP